MTPELTEIQTIVRLQLGVAKADPEDRLVGDLGAVSADIVPRFRSEVHHRQALFSFGLAPSFVE